MVDEWRSSDWSEQSPPKTAAEYKKRVAVVYRVVPHWRKPLFDRVAETPGIELRVFYGANIPGAKHGSGDGEFEPDVYRLLRTIKASVKRGDERVGLPVCPALPLRLAQFAPDIVVMEGASNAPNNFLTLLYCRLRGVPHVWWSLGDLAARHRSVLQRLARRLAYIGERSAAAVLAYSETGAQYFRSRGVPEGRIVVAVNAIDGTADRLRAERMGALVDSLRKRFSPTGEVILLSVGALTAVKRVDRLIALAEELLSQGCRLTLVIVGDGPMRKSLEESTASDHIVFEGNRVDDAAAYFAAADIFALPGLGGLALSQALAHGLPIISAEADGSERDFVRDGENGYLVDGDDHQLWRSRLLELVESEELRERFRRCSLKMYDEGLNFETYVSRFLESVSIAEH